MSRTTRTVVVLASRCWSPAPPACSSSARCRAFQSAKWRLATTRSRSRPRTCRSAAWFRRRRQTGRVAGVESGGRRLHQGRRGRRSRPDGADGANEPFTAVKVATAEAGRGCRRSSRLECERLPSGSTTLSASPASSCLAPGRCRRLDQPAAAECRPRRRQQHPGDGAPAPRSISSSNSARAADADHGRDLAGQPRGRRAHLARRLGGPSRSRCAIRPMRSPKRRDACGQPARGAGATAPRAGAAAANQGPRVEPGADCHRAAGAAEIYTVETIRAAKRTAEVVR